MIKVLAKVVTNTDPEKQKRIQANILGLTDTLDTKTLPWAYPYNGSNDIPEVGDKVWILVERGNEPLTGDTTTDKRERDLNEGFDWNNQRYSCFTEELYKEDDEDEYTESDAYKARNDNILDDIEPEITSDIEYPLNKVVKFGKFTLEYDIKNKRYTLTDVYTGSYFQIDETNGFIIKSVKDLFLLAKSDINLYCEGDLKYTDKNGNSATFDSSGVVVEDKNSNKFTGDTNGIKIEAKGSTVEITTGKVNVY